MPPSQLDVDASNVRLIGDDVFEPQEYLEVSLIGPDVNLPEPFQPTIGGGNLQLASTIEKPDDANLVLDLASTVIIIKGGNV